MTRVYLVFFVSTDSISFNMGAYIRVTDGSLRNVAIKKVELAVAATVSGASTAAGTVVALLGTLPFRCVDVVVSTPPLAPGEEGAGGGGVPEAVPVM